MSQTEEGVLIPNAIISDLTSNPNYYKPYGIKVIIKDKYNEETIHVFDSFEAENYRQNKLAGGRNDIIVTDVQPSLTMGETGEFALKIDDTIDRVVDREILDAGCFVIIQDSRVQGEWRNLLYGEIEDIETIRGTGHPRQIIDPITELMTKQGRERIQYSLTGLGTALLFSHRFLTLQKVASRDDETQEFIRDPRFFAYQMFEDIITNADLLPLGAQGPTLKTHGNYTLEGISDRVKDFIPGVNLPMVVAAQALSFIASAAGAYWMVDEYNNVVFRYPSSGRAAHTGIELKTYTEPDDLAQCTSYVLNDVWSTRDSKSPSNGFANRLFGRGTQEDTVSQLVQNSFTNLVKKDLAQQIPGTNKLRDIGLVLNRTGGGTHESNPETAKLHGEILKDRDNHPTGSVVAAFAIPVKDIPEQREQIAISPAFFVRESQIDTDSLYWIKLNASGLAADDCINWWHNNQFGRPQTYRSAIRPLLRFRTKQDPDPVGQWASTVNGPTYTYSLTSKLVKLAEASDPLSILRWTPRGPVEASVNLPWVRDSKTMNLALLNILRYSAMLQRSFSSLTVTLPYNTFRVGFNVTFTDDIVEQLKKYRNATYEVQEAKYHWTPGRAGLKTAEIVLKGYVSPLEYKIGDDDDSSGD